MNKGQTLLAVIMWGVGISATLFAGSYALITNKFSDVNGTAIDHEKRISAVEVRIERIPIIEEKIDKLLENNNIKFIETK